MNFLSRITKIKIFIILGMMLCGYVHKSIFIENEYDENHFIYQSIKLKEKELNNVNNTATLSNNYTEWATIESRTIDAKFDARNDFQGIFVYRISRSAIILRRFFSWGLLIGSLPSLGIMRCLGLKYSIGLGITLCTLWSILGTLFIKEKMFQMALMMLSGIGHSPLLLGIYQFSGKTCKMNERSQYVVLTAAYYAGSALADITTFHLVDILQHMFVFSLCLFLIVLWNICWWKYSIFPETFVDIKVPWMKVITSPSIILICFSFFGISWAEMVMYLAQVAYMYDVFGLDPKMPWTFLTIIPQFGHLIISFLFAILIDILLGFNNFNLGMVRKLAAYFGHLLPACCLFLVTYTGPDPDIPLGLFTVAWFLVGLSKIGSGASAIDIAPHHAGIIIALCQIFMGLGSIAASYLMEFVIFQNVYGGWHILYGVTAAVMTISGFCFIFGADLAEMAWSKNPYEQNATTGERQTIQMTPLTPSTFPPQSQNENSV